MNEFIKYLALQATTDTQPDDPDYRHETFDKEFFAMLIIKKCIAQCNLVASWSNTLSKNELLTDSGRQLEAGRSSGAISCISSIEEYFGVK